MSALGRVGRSIGQARLSVRLGVRQVGINGGCCGVVLLDGRVVVEGPVRPNGFDTNALEDATRIAGLLSRGEVVDEASDDDRRKLVGCEVQA